MAAATVAGALHLVLNRPEPDDVPVLVATRTLPVGATVGDDDVAVELLPPRAVPSAALVDPQQALDQVVGAPVVQGAILTEVDLRTSALLEGMPSGTVAVFVPLQDAAVPGASTPGDLVDVHSPVDGSLVAEQVRVLRATTGETPGLWLAVDAATSRSLATARGADPLGAALLVALHGDATRE